MPGNNETYKYYDFSCRDFATGKLFPLHANIDIMIEVILNDRLGKKVRVKCNEDDTILDLKKLAAAQLGMYCKDVKML